MRRIVILASVLSLSCYSTTDSPAEHTPPPDLPLIDAIEEDTETNYDTGTETGTEEIPNCPTNSGWPCRCNIMPLACDDGYFCLSLQDAGHGICSYNSPSRTSIGPNIICAETGFLGEPIGIWDKDFEVDPSIAFYCALGCASDDDCPNDQSCISTSGYTTIETPDICY